MGSGLTEAYKAHIVDSIPESDLVLYCPGLHGLGGKLLDRSQSVNHGTIVGADWSSTVRGLRCLKFNGLTDYVTIADDPSFSNPGDKVTYEAWVRRAAVGTWHGIFSNRSDGVGRGINLYPINTNEVQFALATGGGTAPEDVLLNGVTKILANIWYQIVGVYDGANLNLYVNGAVDAVPAAQSGNVYNSTIALLIGAYQNNGVPSELMNGYIALPRIYKRALSAVEVLRHYTRERHLFGV